MLRAFELFFGRKVGAIDLSAKLEDDKLSGELAREIGICDDSLLGFEDGSFLGC
jgi:hypothetical protein